MRTERQIRRAQKSAVFTALLMFQLVLLIIQLWLFTSGLEGVLDGKTALIVPGAAASLLMLGINIWMLIGVSRLDKSR